MIVATLWMAALVVSGSQTPAAKPPALPDTPQGKHVQAYIKAFNSGDEKTFLAANEEHLTPDSLQKNPAERQSSMFKRMKGDFGTFTIEKIVSATPQRIVVVMPMRDGAKGTFTFDFEEKAPFRISGIGVDVRDR